MLTTSHKPQKSTFRALTLHSFIVIFFSLSSGLVFSSPSASKASATESNISKIQTSTEKKKPNVVSVNDFEAVYKARFRGIGVTAIRKLETKPNGEKLLSFIADSWLADLKETSEFRWDDNQNVIPLQYSYSRSGLGRNRQALLDFDWDKKIVVNNVEDKPWSMTVPEFALDKLSYQLQIQSDLVNKKELAPYSIADGGKLKTYEFEIVGKEQIETPAGTFDTIKVKRIHSNDLKRHTYFWLAPRWNYLMVRVQQQDGSQSYEIDLNSAVVNGDEVSGI